MLTSITWISQEKSPVLTPEEVNALFNFTFQMAEAGQLSNGKYVGANVPLYWERLKGRN